MTDGRAVGENVTEAVNVALLVTLVVEEDFREGDIEPLGDNVGDAVRDGLPVIEGVVDPVTENRGDFEALPETL